MYFMKFCTTFPDNVFDLRIGSIPWELKRYIICSCNIYHSTRGIKTPDSEQ